MEGTMRVLKMTFLIVVLSAVTYAQDKPVVSATPPNPTRCSGYVTTGINSQYYGTIANATFFRGYVIPNEVGSKCSRGPWHANVGVWVQKGARVKEVGHEFSDEADVFAGVGRRMQKIDIKVRGQYLNVVSINVANFGGDISTKVTLNEKHTLNISGNYDYYFPTKKGGPTRGHFTFGNIEHTHRWLPRVTVRQKFRVGRDWNGAFGFQPSTTMFSVDIATDITLTKTLTATPLFRLGGSSNDPNRPIEKLWGISLTKTF